MKGNIKLSLFSLTVVRLLTLLRNVVAKLTGNASFPSPPVSLAAMTTLGDELESAILLATEGSTSSRKARDLKAAEVRVVLNAVADYVRMEAKGEVPKLSTSGFELAKQREPIGVPGMAKDMRTRATNSKGTLELRWRHVRGAHGYRVFRTASDPNIAANWEPIGYTTRSSHVVPDLESFKAYWFTVTAIGSAGEGMQCDPAMGRAA